MDDLVIARATPAETQICQSLLPLVAGADGLFFTARDADGLLLGAAGINWQSRGNPPGFPGWIEVLPDRRRRGVGSALAEALVAIARGEMPALVAAAPIAEPSPAAAFALRLGMTRTGGRLAFRADGVVFLRHMDEIVDRLRRSGHIPAGAACVPLDPGHGDAVATMMRQELRVAPAALATMIAQSFGREPAAAPVDMARSRMLLVDDQVQGALLTRRDPDGHNAHIIALAVSPTLRRGWGNAVLLAETTRAGVNTGGKWFEFDCAEDHADTIGLARRGRADMVRTDGFYGYAIAADAPA